MMNRISHSCRKLVSAAAATLIAILLIPAAHSHITECVDGKAGEFTCSKVALAAVVGLEDLGAGSAADQTSNDIWGWTDTETGREYALVGLNNGLAFVDVTQADHPVVLGILPPHTEDSMWRGVKTYRNYAYVVSEASSHGMQIFDLTRLRNVVNPPQTFASDAHYDKFGSAHNIVMNEQSGFAYAVGMGRNEATCEGGLHMMDLADPLAPRFAGCFSEDGYTHDAQCVTYAGPDARYTDREICVNANEDTVTIVDVTDKSQPRQVSRTTYSGAAYTHQGWFDPSQRWFLVNDEFDEIEKGHNTRTYVWDMADLENPKQTFSHTGTSSATDHNLYIHDQYVFQSNYASGIRILDISGIAQNVITEVAFFDTFPENDDAGFAGTWTNYPYFESGTLIASDMRRGLFVLKPDLCTPPPPVSGLTASAAGDRRIVLDWQDTADSGATFDVFRQAGGCANGLGQRIATGLSESGFSDVDASGGIDIGYRIRTANGQCSSEFSECVNVRTTGACTAAPVFGGLRYATSPGTSRCAVDLKWKPAQAICSETVSYDIHRSSKKQFTPDEANRIATTTSATGFSDIAVNFDETFHYLVQARDDGNQSSDDNKTVLEAKPFGPLVSGIWTNGGEVGEKILGSMLKHVAWHVVDDEPRSGERSYASGYAPANCVALYSGTIDLDASEQSQLSYWQRFETTANHDGGLVQISRDGIAWETLTPDGGYPTRLEVADNGCDWANDTGMYSGVQSEWKQAVFDLTAYSGDVEIRWLFSTDSDIVGDEQRGTGGWWIDDIAVSPAQVVGACSTSPDSFAVDAGTSGLWYDVDRNGEGFALEVLDEETAWIIWFTYDTDGKQLWLVGLGEIDGSSIQAEMYRSKASGFGSSFDPADVVQSRWGTLEMAFDSCDEGMFSWQADGYGTGEYPLYRLASLAGVPCGTPSAKKIGQSHSGHFYDPAKPGQGLTMFTLSPHSAPQFYWYTFDTAGDPMWLISVAKREADAITINDWVRPIGARFGAEFDPDDVENVRWGTGIIDYENCNQAGMSWMSKQPGFEDGEIELYRLTLPSGIDCPQ